MEHEQAIENYAAEGYLLDELTAAERADFEEHFFDCESCFADVREGIRFVHALPEAAKETHSNRWLPAVIAASIAVALTAGLADVAVIAPMRVQLSNARGELAKTRVPHKVPPIQVLHGTVRDASEPIARAGAPFILEFSIPPDHPSPVYTCAIVDAHGKTRIPLQVTAEEAKKPVDFELPGGLPAGDYSLTITGTGGVSEPMEFTIR